MIKIDTLDAATDVPDVDVYAVGMYYKDTVLPAMDALRETADTLETIVAKNTGRSQHTQIYFYLV